MTTPRFSPWLRVIIFTVGAAIATTVLGFVVIISMNVAAARAGRTLPDGLGEYALWASALSYPLIWMWLVFCRTNYDQLSVSALGLRAPDRTRALVGGGVAGAFAVAWLFGVLWLCGGVVFQGFSDQVLASSPLTVVGQLALYALLFATVGFMEEAIFRGYLLHNFSASIGLRAAIWLQAIGFALIHLNNLSASGTMPTSAQWLDALRAMPSLALIGAIFALCWTKSGTLWYSIGFHAAWNFVLGCVFSLPVSGLQTFRLFDIAPVGNDWITGGSFGAEGSVLLWPILGALWLVLQRLPDHPQALRDVQLLNIVPQVLAAPENVMTTENETENALESPRNSRFQTSMRAAREADEISSGEIPILGQLSRPDETKPKPAATDFAHDWMTPETSAPAAANSSPGAAFDFQPLPKTESANAPAALQVLAAPISSAEAPIDAPTIDASIEIVDAKTAKAEAEAEAEAPKVAVPKTETSEIANAEIANAEIANAETETPKIETLETQASETETIAPVRRRPTPRW